MKTIVQLSLLITVFCSTSVYSQTVDEIISKHLDAVGGKEKLTGLTSVSMEGTVEVMGQSGTTKSIMFLDRDDTATRRTQVRGRSTEADRQSFQSASMRSDPSRPRATRLS